MRFLLTCVALLSMLLAPVLPAQELTLPLKEGSLRFAVIGDSGTGHSPQYQVAEQLVRYHEKVQFQTVLMLGDNLYGGERERDYEKKFSTPYKTLLDEGVKFYAVLGNHDEATESFYKLFNMNGKRFYTFSLGRSVRFFALDSNYMDPEQLRWLEEQLRTSNSAWKICLMHHPLYSSGKTHGSSMVLRKVLEPLFIKYGVSIAFAGHEHFYQRIKPQNGIFYFVSGGAGKLRKDNIEPAEFTAKGFDRDNHFMLVEILGDQMYFQTISRTGQTVDAGTLSRRAVERPALAATAR